MPDKSGVYTITNTITGDTYIGSSRRLKHRQGQHFSQLLLGKHLNPHLQQAYNKYGKEAFRFEINLTCPVDCLIHYEQELVDKHNPKYNIRRQCVASRLGVPHSPEIKERISKSQLGRKHPHKGWACTDATRQRISQSKKGKCCGGPRVTMLRHNLAILFAP